MKGTFKALVIIGALAQGVAASAANEYAVTIDTKGAYDYVLDIPQDLPAQCSPRELARLKPHHVVCAFLATLTADAKGLFTIKNKNSSEECTLTGTDSGRGLVLGMSGRCPWVKLIGNTVYLE